MIASQMEAARIERTTIDLESADGQTGLRATGQVVLFRRLSGGLRGRPRRRGGRARTARPPARRSRQGAAAKVHRRPRRPALHRAAAALFRGLLVKKMEELGIGRPSTYASILTVLRDRDYVRMDKNRFVPEDAGRLVTAFLEQFFRRYVEYDFTADLEEKLDLVSAGELDWKALLRDFWKRLPRRRRRDRRAAHGPGARGAQRGARPAHLPGQGRRRRSARLPHLRRRAAVAEDRPLRRLHRLLQLSGVPLHPPDRRRPTARTARQPAATASWASIRPRGQTDLAEGRPLRPLRRGGRRDKPKRASLPKDWPPAGHGPRQGAAAAAPAARGRRPSRRTAAMILAGIGRYGPYVQHDGAYANLPTADEVFEVGLNRAVAVLAEKRAGGAAAAARGGDGAEGAGRPPRRPASRCGCWPAAIGPYVKHEAVNANVPKGADPAASPSSRRSPCWRARRQGRRQDEAGAAQGDGDRRRKAKARSQAEEGVPDGAGCHPARDGNDASHGSATRAPAASSSGRKRPKRRPGPAPGGRRRRRRARRRRRPLRPARQGRAKTRRSSGWRPVARRGDRRRARPRRPAAGALRGRWRAARLRGPADQAPGPERPPHPRRGAQESRARSGSSRWTDAPSESLLLCRAEAADLNDGDLVLAQVGGGPDRRYGPKRGKVLESGRPRGRPARRLADRHPRPRHPHRLLRRRRGRSRGRRAAHAARPRGPARPAPGHHRPGRRPRPRRRGLRRAGRRTRATPAAGSSGSPSPMSPPTSGPVRRWTARRATRATASTSPTGSSRCCPSGCRPASARCARARSGACLAVRMVFDAAGAQALATASIAA